MFGIGPTELIVILVIALLVLGPKRLPELAAGLGKGLAEFRRATSDINAELDEARRAVEEPAREAAKATAVADRRVSRTSAGGSRPPAAVQQPIPADPAEPAELADDADDDAEDAGASAKPSA
jgi:sec-independent protein translocase protein TatB